MEKEDERVVSKGYKENCGFMKIGCCTFKPEHCRPQKKEHKIFCDLYNVEFTSKAVKKELDKVKKKIKTITKENLKLSKVKEVVKIERIDALDKNVVEFKKKLLEIKDLDKGVEYLEKAYRYLKRCKR